MKAGNVIVRPPQKKAIGAFSADGQLVASGSEDATVRIWRAADGTLLRSLSDARSGVQALTFTTDGRLLLGASSDHTVRIWEVGNGREWLRLDAHVAPVNDLVLAPDGHSFATAGSNLDGRVRLWSLPEVSPIWQSVGEPAVWSIAFAPNGRVPAAGGSFGTVRLLDASDDTELNRHQAGDGAVLALDYSSDGRLLAASEGSAVHVFGAEDGVSAGLLTGPWRRGLRLTFSPDGRLLASASDDRTVRLWRRPSPLGARFPLGASVAGPPVGVGRVRVPDLAFRRWRAPRGTEADERGRRVYAAVRRQM